MISASHQKVAEHYERYPYPRYPVFSIGSWRDLASVDVNLWGGRRAMRDIWIAGSGTIAPLMFGRRNFKCNILASDLSAKTLGICERRLRLFGVRNIRLKQEDIAITHYVEAFDAIDAFGVIHHTESPEKSLKKLAAALRPGGILRIMVYSEFARSGLERLRQEVAAARADSLNDIKLRIKNEGIEQAGDLTTDEGIADALLNPLVHTYTSETLTQLFDASKNLEIQKIDTTHNFVVFALKR